MDIQDISPPHIELSSRSFRLRSFYELKPARQRIPSQLYFTTPRFLSPPGDIHVAAGVTSVKQDRLTARNTLVKEEMPVRGDGQLPRY